MHPIMSEFFKNLNRYGQRRRTRWQLLSLPRRLRDDLSLSDADIENEASKPFWRD